MARLKKTQREMGSSRRWAKPCVACHREGAPHKDVCPFSQAETPRRQALKKHGINFKRFDAFLHVLSMRYETEERAADEKLESERSEALDELTRIGQEGGEYGRPGETGEGTPTTG